MTGGLKRHTAQNARKKRVILIQVFILGPFWGYFDPTCNLAKLADSQKMQHLLLPDS